jgi:hypothetical protein
MENAPLENVHDLTPAKVREARAALEQAYGYFMPEPVRPDDKDTPYLTYHQAA